MIQRSWSSERVKHCSALVDELENNFDAFSLLDVFVKLHALVTLRFPLSHPRSGAYTRPLFSST